MPYEYNVKSFVPTVAGCGAVDLGWNSARCDQFSQFLNEHAVNGWKLHSSEYRQVSMKGCSTTKGAWLVCVFEREK